MAIEAGQATIKRIQHNSRVQPGTWMQTPRGQATEGQDFPFGWHLGGQRPQDVVETVDDNARTTCHRLQFSCCIQGMEVWMQLG